MTRAPSRPRVGPSPAAVRVTPCITLTRPAGISRGSRSPARGGGSGQAVESGHVSWFTPPTDDRVDRARGGGAVARGSGGGRLAGTAAQASFRADPVGGPGQR